MRLSPVAAAASSLFSRRLDKVYNAAPPNLSTLANASLYSTWRPIAHVLPAYGQIGDPCMHYTDPATGLFHVGYLHLGASGATTSDLVTYTDLNPDSAPFIAAGGKNDPVAVFDGSVIPVGINGTLTLLYTSVSYLPIQLTIRYTEGSEMQSLAVARDGGRNFTKLQHGPVIPSPPFAVNVTGFRDPYVFQSPHMDKVLQSVGGTWYTIMAAFTATVPACFCTVSTRAIQSSRLGSIRASTGMSLRTPPGQVQAGQAAGASASRLETSSLWARVDITLKGRYS